MSRHVGRALFAAALLAALAAATATPAAAAAPAVEYLYPAGGQRGTTVGVTAGGTFERWPVQFWADDPGIRADAMPEKGKLSIHVAATARPGPHLVRLYDAQGPSAPRVFVVDADREVIEAEPDDEVANAQAVGALPAVVNGRLEKSGDVDSYAVRLEAGQYLSAAVQGRRLGAPMDPLLLLHDAAGNQLDFIHDGLGLDPLLVFRAPAAGTYVVRVAGFAHPPAADVRFVGAAGAVYRLALGTGPVVRYATPAGVTRGAKATVRMFGWDGGDLGTRDVDASGVAAVDDALAIDRGAAALPLALGEGPELTEADANAGSKDAAPPSVPVAVTGRLDQAGEEDAIRVAAKKGERLVVLLRAAAVASRMDPVLRLEDEAGKTLAANDDQEGQTGDAKLEWTAPADCVVRAVASDRFGQGGHEYVYRLSVNKPVPGVVATADADGYHVAPGKSAAVKLSVSRTDAYAAGLVAVGTGLPPGVVATAVEVPEKGGDVTLTITAAADAKPAAGPIRVMILSTDPARPAAWVASCALRKDGGQELVARSDALWLTVQAP